MWSPQNKQLLPDELIGLTEEQAFKLKHDKDVAYLRS